VPHRNRIIFVPGSDFLPGGTVLGPRTIARLKRAIAVFKDGGGEFAFAMGHSPCKKLRGEKSGAELMAEWTQRKLASKSVNCHVLSPEGDFFSTFGEVGALYWHLQSTPCREVVVVTGRYHFPRLVSTVRRRFGRSFHRYQFDWRVAEGDRCSVTLVLLEMIKYPCLLIPTGTANSILSRIG
jgi:hypothetical protein